MQRHLRLMAFLLLSLATPLFAAKKGSKAAKAAPETASAEAARVAILLYEDKTGTKNFEYMPGSLKEAITNSMHEKFEFNEVDAAKVAPTAEQIKKKNKGVIGAKEAAEICRKTDIDILIFGSFTFNEAANSIEISTNISLGSTDKFRTLQPVQNKVDSTIFGAADKVATDIVAEITRIAKEQQEAKGKAAEADKNKKTQLEKTEKRKTWADINWNIAFSPTGTRTLISRQTVNTPAIETNPNIYAMYRLRGNWHVGVSTLFAVAGSNSQVSPYGTTVEYWAATANAGYYFDLSPRWRLTNMLGLGYYLGNYSVHSNCGGNPQCIAPNVIPKTPIRNPFFLARTGIHFLIFSFLSAGIEAEYRMLYDSKSIHSVGGALTLTFIF